MCHHSHGEQTCAICTPLPIRSNAHASPKGVSSLHTYAEGLCDLGTVAALPLMCPQHPLPPQAGFVESFNISVAGALVMYEAQQQRIRKLGRHGDLTHDQQLALQASLMMRSLVGHQHPAGCQCHCCLSRVAQAACLQG
jgi:hypothetical protein